MTVANLPGSETRPLRVAVIGSGPSGFYAAVSLLKQSSHKVLVDLYDRLPTPYGLVRGGVAPDHQKIKSVTNIYEKSALSEGFRYFGNVELGKDIFVPDLESNYDQIVYAVGNENDRRMGIPGENLTGCTPATVFVGWYNAHPDYREATIEFSSKKIVVIGNGNVAVDVSRILAKGPEDLRKTDIADYALEALEESQVEEITLIGRRGPVQATFTPPELKELTGIENSFIEIAPEELELDPLSLEEMEEGGAHPKRNVEILKEASNTEKKEGRKIKFKFFVSPVQIIGDENGHVIKLKLEKNELYKDDNGKVNNRGTGVFEEIDADWIFVAIGYQGRRLPDVPFDEKTGTISNKDGRVTKAETGETVPNQYVVGWAKSGPRGLIGMHKQASGAVVELMMEDLQNGMVEARELPPQSAIETLLNEREIKFVTFAEWKAIDEAEQQRGKEREAPRIKYSDVDDMLKAAGKDEVE